MFCFSLHTVSLVAFHFATAGLAAVAPLTSQKCNPIVDLGYAKYHGVRLGNGIDEFLGMRYAAPPLGSLRFRAPADPIHEAAVQDATEFRPLCVGVNETPDPTHAEDCLFVNVFKPSHATSRSKLPVWVYIQGGGYSTNSNGNYNGSEVVSKSGDNLVFVNFNYRVGALGFLASSEVAKDGALNAGLLDQRKVLHWVQENISKFGGDPDHVVIHGVSAGGGSVSYHLTAYGGERDNKLFIGAIPENPFWPTQRTVDEMEFQYERLLQTTNCSELNCLRAVDINTFMASTRNSPFPDAASNVPLPLWYWLPVIDNSLVLDHMYNMFREGRFIRVPLLVGDDTNEGSYFAYNATSADEVKTFMKNNYPHMSGDQLDEMNKLYPLIDPVPKHAAYFPSASAAYGDSTFTCAGNKMAAAFARFADAAKVWNYRYNVIDADNVANGLGVPHAFETTAIIGVGYSGGYAPSYLTTNAPIVPITMAYFISFIRDLNPNTHRNQSAPVWKSWGHGSSQRLRLQTDSVAMEPVPDGLTKNCAFWSGLVKYMEQ